MTDDELRELVASIAIGQKATDAQLQRTDEQLQRTDAQLQRTDEQLQRTDAQLQRTDEQLQRTDEQLQRTDEQLQRMALRVDGESKRTDAIIEEYHLGIKASRALIDEVGRKVERVAELYGHVSQNQGDVAEEFFLNSLLNDLHLGSLHFEDITQGMSKHRGQIQEQYDLVVSNGDAIGVIEVKYKAHKSDLDKLDRKMRHFKQLFPNYRHYKQYGAIASFHINDDAKAEALRRGYFVLQRSGDLVHTESATQLQVM